MTRPALKDELLDAQTQRPAGVATGYATVGRMGFEDRWEYGPVGPVVHVAERLAVHAGAGEVPMSMPCHDRVRARVAAEPAASARAMAVLAVKGAGPDDGELSPREVEVLGLLAECLSNRGIAERLVISEKTAIRHESNIFAKLDVHHRAEATRVALRRGLVA